MATTTQLRADITKLKKAIASKFTPKSAKAKLEAQLKKVEKELADKKAGKKTTSTTASTKATFKSLKDLVRRTKELSIYKGSSERNLQNDAERTALPSSAVKGKRISKGLRSNQHGSKGDNKGHVYYEYRKNRIDVKQPRSKQRYPILEDGGMMADGGEIKYHDTKYGKIAVINEDGKLKADYNKSKFNSTNDFHKFLKDDGLQLKIFGYADGGMMAKGGAVEHGLKQYDTITDISKDGKTIYIQNNKDNRNGEHSFWKVDIETGTRTKWNGLMMAEKGMEMPNGGGIQSSTHKLHG